MTGTCAACGQDVPEHALTCPHCNASAIVATIAEEDATIVSPPPAAAPAHVAVIGRCEVCGAPVTAGSTHCAGCAPAAPSRSPSAAAERPGLDPRPTIERFEALTPGGKELAAQLGEQLRTPAVATALVGGALAAVAVFAIGLVLGIAFSDRSTLGIVDQGKGIAGAGLAQTLGFLQVGYDHGVGKLGPALFLAFPVGACALAALTQARRTRGLTPGARLVSGASIGVVFGLLMLIPVLAAGTLGEGAGAASVSGASAILLGALWGGLGGLLGTYGVVRGESDHVVVRGIPAGTGDIARTIFVALRPLVLALGLMAVVGTLAWTVETLRKPSVRFGMPAATAAADNAAFAVEHGVHWMELGALAQFRTTGATSPVPVGDASRIDANGRGEYRIFGLAKAMPAYTFALVLLWTVGTTLLLALSAGFGVARLRGAVTPAQGAAWGAIVGPTWAIAMVLVNAVVATNLFSRAVADSVFGAFLLGGVIVGAAGGILGARPRTPTVSAPLPTAQ